MRLNVFFQAFQTQSVLIVFLLSMKNSYLLTTENTLDVNNFLYFYMVCIKILQAIFCMLIETLASAKKKYQSAR